MRMAGVIIGAVLLNACITFDDIDDREKTLENSGSDSAAQRDTAEMVSTDSSEESTHGPELETETMVSTDRPNADGSDSVEEGTEIDVESDTMRDSADLGESDIQNTDSEMTVSTDSCADDAQCLPAYRCDQGACVPKNAEGQRCGRDGDCLSNHCSQGTCCEEGECCADFTDCEDVARPICAPERFQCVGCDVLDACEDMYPFKPYCDHVTGTCVECRSDDDCRAGTVFDSVLGICTKDGTCTCGVSEERGSCESEDDCPDETFCAVDASNTIAGDDFEHYVCLRSCAPPSDSIRGVSCEERPTRDDGTKWVWAPATSCFAFDRFGANCESSDGSLWPDTCRLSDTLKDGECAESDDLPGTYYCTYSCYDSVTAKGDDARCRAFDERDNGTCGDPNEVCLLK